MLNCISKLYPISIEKYWKLCKQHKTISASNSQQEVNINKQISRDMKQQHQQHQTAIKN